MDPGRDGGGSRARSEKRSVGPPQTWGRDWTSRSDARTEDLVISTRKGLLQDATLKRPEVSDRALKVAGERRCPTQESPAAVIGFLSRHCPAEKTTSGKATLQM